jgi:chemotaxis protein MotB
MKRWIVMSLIMLMGGCAAFGPSVDDPRLQSEYEAALQALREAREWNAPTYQSERYTEAENQFRAVRERHQSDPSEAIISDYRMVQLQANRATIDSLISQLEEKQQEAEQLRSKVNRLSRTVQNQSASLDERASTIDQLRASRDTLGDTVASLRDRLSRMEQYADTVARHEETIEAQREKITSLADKNETLNERVQELRSNLQSLREERNELRSRNRTLGDSLASLQTKMDSRTAQLRQLRSENRKVAEKLEEQLDEGSVRRERDRVVVNLQEKILFGLGSAHLKDEARRTIQDVMDVLEQYEERRVLVAGHTDDLPIKETLEDTYASNWELSAQRAINVVKYMVHGLGVDGDRLGAVAYGQTRPLVPNTSTENRAKNRRVEIVLLPSDFQLESVNDRSGTTPDG